MPYAEPRLPRQPRHALPPELLSLRLLSVPQAAALLSYSTSAIYKMIADGRIDTIVQRERGKRIRIPMAALQRYIKDNECRIIQGDRPRPA